MTWIKQNEELYIHNIAPFSLIKINGEWFVTDSRDQSKAVPYSDIFNNPVYNIDFSDKTLLAKHFRAEGVNTPGTPGFSFQGDSNLGLYRIDEDRLGFAANGIRQGEFGVGYGGFTGNIIQLIFDTQSFAQVVANVYTDINKSASVVWETAITPKIANSKIFILYSLSALFGGTPPYLGGIRILAKIGSGSYNLIYRPQEENATSPFGPLELGGDTSVARTKTILPFYHNPTYSLGDTITYKIQMASYSASSSISINISRTGNNGSSQCFLSEIAG